MGFSIAGGSNLWGLLGGGGGDKKKKAPQRNANRVPQALPTNPLWQTNISGPSDYTGGSYEQMRANQIAQAQQENTPAGYQDFLRSISGGGGSFDFTSKNPVSVLDTFAKQDRSGQLLNQWGALQNRLNEARSGDVRPSLAAENARPGDLIKALRQQVPGMSKHAAQNALYQQYTDLNTELDKVLGPGGQQYLNQTVGKEPGGKSGKEWTPFHPSQYGDPIDPLVHALKISGDKNTAKELVKGWGKTWEGQMDAFNNNAPLKAQYYAERVLVPQFEEKINTAEEKAQEYAAWLAGGKHGSSPITGFTTLFKELGLPADMPVTPENIWAAAQQSRANMGGLMQDYLTKELAKQNTKGTNVDKISRTLQSAGYTPTDDPVINQIMILDAMKNTGLTWAPKKSSGTASQSAQAKANALNKLSG